MQSRQQLGSVTELRSKIPEKIQFKHSTFYPSLNNLLHGSCDKDRETNQQVIDSIQKFLRNSGDFGS